jgi:hypothetical protein
MTSADYAAAEALLAEALGEQTVTVVHGNQETTFSAAVEPEALAERDSESGSRKAHRERMLTICTDGSLGYDPIAPYLRMRVTIGALEYNVSKIDWATPLAILTLTRVIGIDHTKPDFRK